MLRSVSARFRAVALVAVLSTIGLVPMPATSQAPQPAHPLEPDSYGFQGEGPERLQFVDRREGIVAPSAERIAAAEGLGAQVVRWNAFGTPRVLMTYGGHLTDGADGAAVDIARDFLAAQSDLFGLDDDAVRTLEVVRDLPLYDSPDLGRVWRMGEAPANPDVARIVEFRQVFDGHPAAWDGGVTVGITDDGRITWVSSSLTPNTQVEDVQPIDATQALAAAALDVRRTPPLLEAAGDMAGYQAFVPEGTASEGSVADLTSEVLLARLGALPVPGAATRLVWETILLDLDVEGSEFGVPTAYRSFVDAATSEVLIRDNRVEHIADGMFGAAATATVPTQLDGLLDPVGSPAPTAPQWNVFPSNPPLGPIGAPGEDIREVWCWTGGGDPTPGCAEEQFNVASRVPWDFRPDLGTSGLPTFTTDGNNASTAISEASFLTPDTAFNRPVAVDRNFDYDWQDRWNTSGCDPTNFGSADGLSEATGVGNDDAAAVTNLFVMHNRMHDWSYFLGLTEINGALQQSNFGNTGPDREGDPEIGSAQAGRRSFNGRDNANQITLPDGLPGITNQYLWEPLAGAFYGACADGAYDMAVVAHEYGHAVANRMTNPIGGSHGQTQGQTESWPDLMFVEYFRGFDISTGEGANPVALAPYVSGDPQAGIRNYPMDLSPLNFSNVDYDGFGPLAASPHSNGEIWSAINFDISERLIETYDDQFPADDAALQRRCAEGDLAADRCPGNRRWVQLMFDSFALQGTGPSMLDSRDAMLAADVLRFDGANQQDLWDVFAANAMGVDASATGPRDTAPVPDWTSPLREDHAQVTFQAVDVATGQDLPVPVEVYVGDYTDAAMPAAVADADGATDGLREFVPGSYDFIARADGFGAARFSATLTPGEQTVEVPLRLNLASAANAATISGDGNQEQLVNLIDDTESTQWQSIGDGEFTDEEGRQVEGVQVTVDLAGDEPVEVAELQISASLRSGSRFSALRSFDVLTCTATDGVDCSQDGDFALALESPDDAFPAIRPRPRVPELNLRPFTLAQPVEATHLRLVVRDNQCTGGPDYTAEANPVNNPGFEPGCAVIIEAGEGGPVPNIDRAILNPPVDQVRFSELQVFGVASSDDDRTPGGGNPGVGNGNNPGGGGSDTNPGGGSGAGRS
jgi:hypothetical protein